MAASFVSACEIPTEPKNFEPGMCVGSVDLKRRALHSEEQGNRQKK